MKKYLTLFQNVKFNVWLFVALALSSVLGTLLPQFPEVPEKVQEFIARSPRIGPIMEKLGFFNIYYSWWFIGMLGLMAFNVIICKLVFAKYPGTKTFKKGERHPDAIRLQKFKDEFASPLPFHAIKDKALALLLRRKYSVQEKIMPDGSLLILASKQRLQRFGSWVSHICIVLVLLANLTGALYGFREVLNIAEGTSGKMQNRPWVISCDKFIVEWYEGSQTPKTFASDLRLFTNGLLKSEKRIVVNEPMEFQNVRFYQATYGPYLREARIGMFRKNYPKESPTMVLKLDEESKVPGTPYSVRILQFAPDFAFDENNEPSSKSAAPKNPAIQILISRDGKAVRAPWIFERLPGKQMPPVPQEDELIPILSEYVPSYYTGLQITYDPGADLFWTACTLLVLSLMLLFYFHHRKVWIHLKEVAGAGSAVWLGGFSSRGPSFEGEFLQISHQLKSGG